MTDEPATAWVDARLAAIARARTGLPAVVADQPWGRVVRMPTALGPVWLKCPSSGLRFELALLPLLAELEPRLTPTVLATEPATGWLLLADAGVTFTDRYDEAELPARFAAALVQVGRLQRASSERLADLLAAGVADLRPHRIVARFDELVLDLDAEVEVRPVRPLLVAACAALAASRVPAGIDHDDLHDSNLLVDAAGRVTVLDWGDSVVAHPFALLLVAQRVLMSLLGDVVPNHPAILDARRGYLAVFADLAPGEDLERTARLAVVVAHVARAWVWRRALASFTAVDADPGRFADAPREWLALAARALRDSPDLAGQ